MVIRHSTDICRRQFVIRSDMGWEMFSYDLWVVNVVALSRPMLSGFFLRMYQSTRKYFPILPGTDICGGCLQRRAIRNHGNSFYPSSSEQN